MSGRTQRLEFLVVGGGPAGTASAITLATAGREVLLVERSNYSAQRIGETLPPAANPVLERLGMASELFVRTHERSPGTVCCWGHAEPYANDFLFDPDGEGWHLDRSAFDRSLAMCAARAGADVLLNSKINECGRSGDRWYMSVECGGELRSYAAPVLIDAAGRRKWRGRPGSRRAFDRQVAIVADFEIPPDHCIDRRAWIEAAHSGWWYSSALPGNRLMAAYFTDADLLSASASTRSTNWKRLLHETRWTRERLSRCRPVERLTVVSASSTITSLIAADGYVAVGDAAVTIDPLSSHGVLYAMSTGIDAATALLDGQPEQSLRSYALETAARFYEDLGTRQYFCELERRWPDSAFWQRRTVTPSAIDNWV